jgi:hypothetical protein
MCQITRERIRNYSRIKQQVENQMERLARMKNEELIPALKMGDESKRNPGASDRMANAVIRRMAYEDEIAASMEKNLTEMEAVRAAIATLTDPMEQEVINMRYIDCEGYRHTLWSEVALNIYGDDDDKYIRAVQRLHTSAMDNLCGKEEEI